MLPQKSGRAKQTREGFDSKEWRAGASCGAFPFLPAVVIGEVRENCKQPQKAAGTAVPTELGNVSTERLLRAGVTGKPATDKKRDRAKKRQPSSPERGGRPTSCTTCVGDDNSIFTDKNHTKFRPSSHRNKNPRVAFRRSNKKKTAHYAHFLNTVNFPVLMGSLPCARTRSWLIRTCWEMHAGRFSRTYFAETKNPPCTRLPSSPSGRRSSPRRTRCTRSTSRLRSPPSRLRSTSVREPEPMRGQAATARDIGHNDGRDAYSSSRGRCFVSMIENE